MVETPQAPAQESSGPGTLEGQETFRPPLSLEELLEFLARGGLIDSARAEEVESRKRTLHSQVLKEKVGSVRSQAASRYDVSPAEIVAAAGFAHGKEPRRTLNEEAIAQCIAEAALYPYRKLDPLKLDNDLVTRSFSRAYANRHVVVPVGRNGDVLELAIADPFDSALRESIETNLGRPVQYVIASKKDIVGIIERVHGFRSKVHLASEELDSESRSTALIELVELQSNDELSASTEAHVVAAVDYLLKYAFDQRASDIHLDPKQDEASVRFRIDGILHDIEQLPLSVHGAIASRIKVLARMDVAERRRPQDGRIKTQNGEQEVELRVSSMATAYGEKIVIRVFDPNVLLAELHELGFTNEERERFESWITSPSGLILVTGPTGSGKTTTLYSTLRYLAGPEINITSVEDPIELIDPRFSQVQVQPQIDVTFARALRTILRHHGGRNSGCRDRQHGGPGRTHRSSRLLHRPYSRRRGCGDPTDRTGGRTVPSLQRPTRCSGPETRAENLSTLWGRCMVDTQPNRRVGDQDPRRTPGTTARPLRPRVYGMSKYRAVRPNRDFRTP